MKWPLICSLVALLSLAPATSRSEPAQGTWTQIEEDDGIKVWRLDVPGQDLPGFRGETVIPRSIAAIVEELKQVEHHTEWMHRCSASETLKRIDDKHVVIYNRVDVPWPVWDRDVVLDTQFRSETEGRLVVLTFKNHDPSLRPPPERVVRMPRLQGFYRLWQLTPERTKVVYQVEADVGGAVPKWMAARVARDMPYETLSRLRERVVSRHPARAPK
jgi:hypothetical protein